MMQHANLTPVVTPNRRIKKKKKKRKNNILKGLGYSKFRGVEDLMKELDVIKELDRMIYKLTQVQPHQYS